MSKKVYPVYSKWAEIFEDDIIEDIDEKEWERANNIEESDETILYALPYGFVRSHISEVKKVGITEGTLEKIKNTRENFQVKQIDSDGDIHDMGLVSDYWFDIDDIKSEENKTEKGRRIEREAYDISCQIWGSSKVEIVNDNFGKDPFGFLDLMVLDPVKMIQVKSNSFNKTKYKSTISRIFDLDKYDLELWLREDYKGWKFYQVENNKEVSFNNYLEVSSCSKDEVVKRLRDL